MQSVPVGTLGVAIIIVGAAAPALAQAGIVYQQASPHLTVNATPTSGGAAASDQFSDVITSLDPFFGDYNHTLSVAGADSQYVLGTRFDRILASGNASIGNGFSGTSTVSLDVTFTLTTTTLFDLSGTGLVNLDRGSAAFELTGPDADLAGIHTNTGIAGNNTLRFYSVVANGELDPGEYRFHLEAIADSVGAANSSFSVSLELTPAPTSIPLPGAIGLLLSSMFPTWLLISNRRRVVSDHLPAAVTPHVNVCEP